MNAQPGLEILMRTSNRPATEVAHQTTVFLDRDGVVNKKATLARYVRTWGEFEWLPEAREALRLLAEAGLRVIVITNQAGIGRGVMTAQQVRTIHERMCEEVQAAGGWIDAVYWCPHGWDDGCTCRKPRPGMLHQAQRDFGLDLSQVVFVGDDERDGQTSAAAGCRWLQVTGSTSLLDIARHLVAGRPRLSDVALIAATHLSESEGSSAGQASSSASARPSKGSNRSA